MISQTNIELVVLIIAAAFIVFLEMVRIVSTIKDNTKEENLKMIKSWLLSVIVNAEKIYGGKTGKVKLSYVYGLFVEKFPKLAKIITFETFSMLVDEVLKINESYINNSNNTESGLTFSTVTNPALIGDNPYGVRITPLNFTEEGK